MKGNLATKRQLQSIHYDTASYVVALGTAGYVDTDISATVGLHNGLVLIGYSCAAAQKMGARNVGETTDPGETLEANKWGFAIANCTEGVVGLRRNAGNDAVYHIYGVLR